MGHPQTSPENGSRCIAAPPGDKVITGAWRLDLDLIGLGRTCFSMVCSWSSAPGLLWQLLAGSIFRGVSIAQIPSFVVSFVLSKVGLRIKTPEGADLELFF